MLPEAEREASSREDYEAIASAQVESEFFTQLQELRDRIRLWEAKNGDDFSSRPS